jgi:cytochrome c oxidase cbb3-type subunit III
MKLNILKYLGAVLIFLAGFAGNVLAQTTEAKDTSLDSYAQAVGWILLLAVLVMFILVIVYGNEKYKYFGIRKKSPSLVKIRQLMTRAVPVEQEQEIMFDHAYDGIKELDNKIPPWFNILFYGTICFAVIYMLVFHVFHLRPLMIDEYIEEVRAADIQRQELIKSGAFVNEDNVTLLTDQASLQGGKSIFMTNCVPCHGVNGEGTVGPNLTDDYWIHGGGIKNVFKTIKYGVPAKGMITWQTLLNPKQMQEVGSFIISLRGINPPNGKPPEGNLYVPPPPDTSKTKEKAPGDSIKVDTSKMKTTEVDSTKVNTPNGDTSKVKTK